MDSKQPPTHQVEAVYRDVEYMRRRLSEAEANRQYLEWCATMPGHDLTLSKLEGEEWVIVRFRPGASI